MHVNFFPEIVIVSIKCICRLLETVIFLKTGFLYIKQAFPVHCLQKETVSQTLDTVLDRLD